MKIGLSGFYLSLILYVNLSFGQSYKSDSLILVDLYNSTNGSEWNNKAGWLTKAPLYEWYGVEASLPGRYVTSVKLPGNNLRGELPSSITSFGDRYTNIDLSNNSLSGTIPDFWT